jgi:exonuclease SbcC
MYKLKSVSIRDVSPFQSVDVKLTDNEGLVIITGDNHDGKAGRGLNNGSGKSMLLNTIANCRFGGPPTNDVKNSKKDMLQSKSSCITMRFIDPQGSKIQFVQGQKDWKIIQDGVDLKVHTNKNQIAKMEELFPITEQEFYAYTYVSSLQNREVHFQNAKPEARLKFITSVFRLDDYDRMKKYYSQQLGLIKEEQIRFDVLEGKLLGVSANLSRINMDDSVKAVYSKVCARLTSLQSQLDDIGIEHSRLLVKSVELRNKKKLIVKLEELRSRITNFNAKELKQLKRKAEAYAVYHTELSAYEENSSSIRAQLKELGRNRVKINKLESECADIEEKLDKLKSKLSDARKHNEFYDDQMESLVKLKEQFKALGFKKPVEFTKSDEDELSVCSSTLQLKKLLDHDHGSSCPTCQQRVDRKSIAKSVKLAQNRKEELETLMRGSKLSDHIRKAKETLVERVDTAELESKVKPLRKRKDELLQDIKHGRKVNSLLDSLKSLRKPEECERTEKKPSYYEVQLHLLSEYNTLTEEVGSDYKGIDKRIAKVESELKSLTSLRSELQSKYGKLAARKTQMDTTMGEYKILHRQQREILQELEGVKPLLEKRDLYKALEKAWSSKGMKIDVANDIVAQLESNLNKYSDLLYPEPMVFKSYVNEKGVFCEVHRGHGKQPTDVRLMSGAESDAFKLLFLLSTLLIIDGNRRTNFVLLDEPDSHMDDVFRSLYITRFLPFLREVVPHTFIVTPKDYSDYENAEVWRVVKRNGVSKLVIE